MGFARTIRVARSFVARLYGLNLGLLTPSLPRKDSERYRRRLNGRPLRPRLTSVLLRGVRRHAATFHEVQKTVVARYKHTNHRARSIRRLVRGQFFRHAA